MLAISAAMGAMGAGLALAIKGQLNAADEMGKAAQKFGVPVEALSRLKYAADLSDVAFETLGAGLKKLSTNMVAAANGGKSQTAMFAALGVEVVDAEGKLRGTEAVLQDVAAQFASMPDGAEKTALAVKLFGKAGAEMIPLLNAGKTGLQAMAEEATKLGIVISADTAKSAENFNDNLTRLKGAMSGLVVQITAALAPTLEKLSGWAVEVTKNFGELSPATRDMIVQLGAILGQ
jgi:TP901 family phage tail tape measure protein